jgi:hypothetical protein
MIVILAAAAAILTPAPDWCTDKDAADKPRNVENTQACAAAGQLAYWDRMFSFRDGPLTCKNAGKELSGVPINGDPPRVGDGYWVHTFDLSKDEIRCHIVKIDGATIEMR